MNNYYKNYRSYLFNRLQKQIGSIKIDSIQEDFGSVYRLNGKVRYGSNKLVLEFKGNNVFGTATFIGPNMYEDAFKFHKGMCNESI